MAFDARVVVVVCVGVCVVFVVLLCRLFQRKRFFEWYVVLRIRALQERPFWFDGWFCVVCFNYV